MNRPPGDPREAMPGRSEVPRNPLPVRNPLADRWLDSEIAAAEPGFVPPEPDRSDSSPPPDDPAMTPAPGDDVGTDENPVIPATCPGFCPPVVSRRLQMIRP